VVAEHIHVPAVAEAPAAVESFDVDPVVAERSCSAVHVAVAAAVAQDLPCDDAALVNAAAEHCAAGAVAYAAYDAAAAAAAAVAAEHVVDAVDENDDSAVLPAVDVVA
jgi:hypothetical protein